MINRKWYYFSAGLCAEGALWCALFHWGLPLAIFFVGGVVNWIEAERRAEKE